MLQRYLNDQFNEDTRATIGVDFYSKDLKLNQEKLKIQFFDTAGQEKYRSICATYYKNADGILLVYDISNRESFENIQKWLDEIY